MRQKIRKGMVLVSFILFPLTIYFFSPVLILESASKGIVNGSFLIFSALFASSLLLGRAFCGWVCPGAGLQEACFSAQNKPARGGKLDWIKYFIWVPWVSAIVFLAIVAGGYHSVQPLYQLPYTGPMDRQLTEVVVFFIIYTFFVALIAVLAFTAGRRAFCHYVCWMAPFMVIGRRLRSLVRWPSLQLKADIAKCIRCGRCSKDCPMSLDVQSMVLAGDMENTECILCGTCTDVCPKKAISY